MSVLYQIDKQLERLLMLEDGNAVDTETGEVFSPQAIDDLQMEWRDKVEGCLLFIKDQKAKAAAIAEEIDNLKERKERHERRAERIANYVRFILQNGSFETPRAAVSYRKTTRCEVHVDAEDLPEQFKNTVTKVTPLKKELTEYLKAGNRVDGVELITESKMSVL